MSSRIIRWLCVSYGIAAVLLACPYIYEHTDGRYQGSPLYYGSDFSHYVVRLQEGLLHPLGDTGNGIFSFPDNPPGMQPAGLEQIGGFLFAWTGWRGMDVMILLSIMFGAAVIPLLQRLLVRTGIGEGGAFAGAFLYFFLFFGPLSRFVHQSWSMPLSLVAFLLLWRFWERQTLVRAAFAGVALGVLPYSYYWSWTFVWTIMGVLFLFSVSKLRDRNVRMGWEMLLLLLTIVAAPYFLHMFSLLGSDVAREAAERSSLVLSRGVESYPRSFLTFLMAVCGYLAIGRERKDRLLLPIVGACIASFVVLHQQFIHGQVISFATHYYPYICLTALFFGVTLIARKQWNPLTIVSGLICFVFLLTAFLDYKGRNPFRVIDEHFAFQHFVTLLPVLDAEPKQVILTDLQSSLVVAANTKHDVVFTEHARHLLISTQEYAERYCLTTLFAPDAHPEWIADMLVETGRLNIARQDELHAERLVTATDACRRVRSNPKEWLQRYGVTMLLWNEKDHPEWKIDLSLFMLDKQGDGWSVWKRIDY
jgi:hypothetical protein